MPAIVNAPWLFVTEVLTTPVARCFALIVTPGRTAPDGSVTVPLSVAVAPPWA